MEIAILSGADADWNSQEHLSLRHEACMTVCGYCSSHERMSAAPVIYVVAVCALQARLQLLSKMARCRQWCWSRDSRWGGLHACSKGCVKPSSSSWPTESMLIVGVS
jgi:hypothetical protein